MNVQTLFTTNQNNFDMRIAIDTATLSEIRQLRKDKYKGIYPDMDLDNDLLDQSAIVVYTRNEQGEVNSTARFALDGPTGLPEDEFLADYRQRKKRLLEFGRFIISGGGNFLLKAYYRTAYAIATNLHCDAIVMAMKPKDISFHQRLIGVNVISRDMGITYGGPFSLACVVWEITNTKAIFFNWIGVEK